MGFLINFMSYLYLISFSIFTAKAQKTENNKISILCVLCGSNERSEWAVNYRIKLNPTAVKYGLK